MQRSADKINVSNMEPLIKSSAWKSDIVAIVSLINTNFAVLFIIIKRTTLRTVRICLGI